MIDKHFDQLSPNLHRRIEGVQRVLKDHRNSLSPNILGLFVIAAILVLAIFAPLIATHEVDEMDFMNIFALPGEGGHLFGTDDYGRDLFSRLVYGSRISLMVGIVAV